MLQQQRHLFMLAKCQLTAREWIIVVSKVLPHKNKTVNDLHRLQKKKKKKKKRKKKTKKSL